MSKVIAAVLPSFCHRFAIVFRIYARKGRCMKVHGGHYLTNGGAAPCSENERPDEWAQIGLEG